jgi:hypothetical protein
MDRNFDVILLPSAARTAAPTVPNWRNRRHAGLQLTLHVTAASGAGGLTVHIQATDRDRGGAPTDLLVDGAAITATGTYVFVLHPFAASGTWGGGPANGVRAAVSGPLPQDWRVAVAHGDGSSYTYSLTAAFLR